MARFPKRTLNILSLMMCDLGNSALTLVIHLASRDKLLAKGVDVIAPMTLALQIGSIFHINSIVVTRLIACAKPFCYKRWVTRRRVLCTVLSAWVISSILLLQILLNSKPEQPRQYPVDVLATNSQLVMSCQLALMIILTILLGTMIRHVAYQLINYKKRDTNLHKPQTRDSRKRCSPEAGNIASSRSRTKLTPSKCNTGGIRKDFILTRHIYIIVWSVILLTFYHVMYAAPIIYMAAQKHLSTSHREILREFCVLGGTFGTLVNSSLFAVPLIKGKLMIGNSNKITERERQR
ncbi:uncharacterized protein LOC134811816 [Bolinopsis microptera]|uniref:uncharacterized protein LOC134811816 n=1 Tax=Bolinopsis microptera TaxID=2820187 RepID=UPI00307995AB